MVFQLDPIACALWMRALQELVLYSLGQKLKKLSPGPVKVVLRKMLVTILLFFSDDEEVQETDSIVGFYFHSEFNVRVEVIDEL